MPSPSAKLFTFFFGSINFYEEVDCQVKDRFWESGFPQQTIVLNLLDVLQKKILLSRIVTSNIIGTRIQKRLQHFDLKMTDSQQSKGKDGTIFIPLYHFQPLTIIDRSSHQRFSLRKVFLEILQNSQEHTCPRVSFLIKLQAWGLQLY